MTIQNNSSGVERLEQHEAEARAMLECARLNPRETGNSIYMQMAIIADKKANALRAPASPPATGNLVGDHQ